jgi:VanZ family protein
MKFLPGIAWFIAVMIIICLPGNEMSGSGWLSIAKFDKLIHATMFGGLVFLFCMPFKKAAMDNDAKKNLFIRITIATIVWGLATEFIQKYFILGRQYDLADWLADSAGAIAAYFISRKLFIKTQQAA